jgi:hypothetical protein
MLKADPAYSALDIAAQQKLIQAMPDPLSGCLMRWMLPLSAAGLQQRFTFTCQDWLKGARCERRLVCTAGPGATAGGGGAAVVTYKVVVTTSDIRGAGTDADVTLVLYGSQGDSGEQRLESSANDFERGKVRALSQMTVPICQFANL